MFSNFAIVLCLAVYWNQFPFEPGAVFIELLGAV